MKRFFIVCLFMLFCDLLPQAAAAQDDTLSHTPGKDGLGLEQKFDAMEIFMQLPAEEQEEILAEADAITQRCQGKGVYSQLHDCDCMSRAFIERRILEGPKYHQYSIMHDIAAECVNIPGVAGYGYRALPVTVTRPV